MLKNFLVVAIRNLHKNSFYSIINISGLAIGVMSTILILLWVKDEVSFDTFLPRADRLYQVYVNADFDGKVNTWRSVPLPTYEEMKIADSNITNSAVTGWGGDRLLKYEDTRVMKRGYYVSEEFLDMFQFPLLYGNASDVLDDPSSIVISESTAKILFGEQDPLNKIIRVDDASELRVTGVLKDIPKNSSFQFDYLLTWKHRESVNEWVVENKDNWGNYSFQIFVELNDAVNAADVQNSIRDILTKKGETDVPREFFIHPLLKWRLHSNFENGKSAGGIYDYVQLLSIIAMFILLIACINFMNLATARSEQRAREVGIRKSIGSNRMELILQFLGESLFIAVLAFTLAIILTLLVLPAYNNLVDKQLFIDFTSARFWLFTVGLILLTGIVSGSYPAFYLSSFKPVATLKGKIAAGKGGGTPRKVLVIMQFGFSILLMIGSVVIYNQIDLIKKRQLGYDQQNLITVDLTDALDENYSILKTDLLQSGEVVSMTRSNSAITQINSNNFLGWPGKPEDQKVIFTTITTEYDYAKTMGIKVLMGRDFSQDFKSDTAAIVINQAALDLMNLEEPLGTELNLWGNKRNLIGVVDNVLMGSPYEEIKPMFMILEDWGGVITVRLRDNNDIQATLVNVKTIFDKYNPAYPFDYLFTDVEYQKKFTIIALTQKLATLFSILAFIITGLGLFGLASFTAEQRTKEIGIRKVLGASVISLVNLMSKEFSRLVILSFIISAPLAWWLLNKYLERYPVRVSLNWSIFALVGVVTLIFALVIVSNQAVRAAHANPVNSLRNE